MTKVRSIQNVVLGKFSRITVNNMEKDSRLNKFFNENMMSALDNYAEHEKININIKSLENDMFNDIAVSVVKDNETKSLFPMDLPETKKEIPEFFRDLYNKIHKGINKPNESSDMPKAKRSIWRDLKMYITNVADRYNDMRYSLIDKLN